MSHCVLGTNRDHVRRAPPCRSWYLSVENVVCRYPGKQGSKETHDASYSRMLNGLTLTRDQELERTLENLSLEELSKFEWEFNNNYVVSAATKRSPFKRGLLGRKTSFATTLPLGALCLPGLRWILRIHHLNDDESTRYLLREYILSAWNVAQKFSKFLDETNPRAVVVFNGQFYPEATARYVAQKRGHASHHS